jgi:nucleotide-binding universal stress UspA family protein
MKTQSAKSSSRLVAAAPRTRPRSISRARRGLPSVTPQKILVPIDFSPESIKAIKYAAALAKQYEAAITLLHVVEPIHFVLDYGYGPVTREQPNDPMRRSARTHLRRLGKRHFANERPWDAIVRSGTAFTEITKAAKELGTDLILMPTRGLTDSKEVSLGSTAERVVRHAPCPVLTLKKPPL